MRAMFDRIARRYDGLNRLFTAGLDQRWRRLAVAAIGIGPGDRVLDLACGTGDLAELAAQRGARVVGVDFAREMLGGARRRQVDAALVQADCARLPLPSGFATAAVCGFALRNFVSLPQIFAELRDQINHYPVRQRVLPGITGWAQVNQAYDQTLDDVRRKVNLDLEYLDRRSAVEDVRIMLRTVPVVLLRRGAM